MQRELTYSDYADKLEGEYKEAYEKIYIYVNSFLTTGDEIEAAMNDMVDLLLSAQMDGKPVETVVGKDLQTFCKGVVKGNKNLSGIILVMVLYISLTIVFAIFEGLAGLFHMADAGMNAWTENINVFPYVSGLLIGLVLGRMVDMMSAGLVFRTRNFDIRRFKILRFSALVVSIVLIVSVVIMVGIDVLHFSIPVPRWGCIAFCILYAIIVTIIGRRYAKGHIEPEENILSEQIDTNDELWNACIDVLRKKYRKKEERWKRRGQTVLPVKEWYENDTKICMLANKAGAIFLALVIFCLWVLVVRDSSVITVVIFTPLLIIIEFPIFLAFWEAVKIRRGLNEIINQMDTDIFDERLKKKPVREEIQD